MYKIKRKSIVIFLAGAEFFHTIGHIVTPYFVKLPLYIQHMGHMQWTVSMNAWAIGINAVITIGLLWWACRLKK